MESYSLKMLAGAQGLGVPLKLNAEYSLYMYSANFHRILCAIYKPQRLRTMTIKGPKHQLWLNAFHPLFLNKPYLHVVRIKLNSVKEE